MRQRLARAEVFQFTTAREGGVQGDRGKGTYRARDVHPGSSSGGGGTGGGGSQVTQRGAPGGVAHARSLEVRRRLEVSRPKVVQEPVILLTQDRHPEAAITHHEQPWGRGWYMPWIGMQHGKRVDKGAALQAAAVLA